VCLSLPERWAAAPFRPVPRRAVPCWTNARSPINGSASADGGDTPTGMRAGSRRSSHRAPSLWTGITRLDGASGPSLWTGITRLDRASGPSLWTEPLDRAHAAGLWEVVCGSCCRAARWRTARLRDGASGRSAVSSTPPWRAGPRLSPLVLLPVCVTAALSLCSAARGSGSSEPQRSIPPDTGVFKIKA